MANETLIQSIKQIITLGKTGDADGANAMWSELFSSAEFATYRPEDQRQALKLVILAKRSGPPAASLVEVFRSTLAPLQALTAAHSEPADFEMLGLSQMGVGSPESAEKSFRAGLELERASDSGSLLCGRLMKHLAST